MRFILLDVKYKNNEIAGYYFKDFGYKKDKRYEFIKNSLYFYKKIDDKHFYKKMTSLEKKNMFLELPNYEIIKLLKNIEDIRDKFELCLK